MRVWYIPTLDCGIRIASYYEAVRKEEVARRRSGSRKDVAADKRVWTDLVEPVGKAGRQGGGRERGGGRSVGRTRRREGRKRRLRCVGGVAVVVVAGRGRLVDGGGGGSWAVVGGHSRGAVQTVQFSRAQENSSAATARRRLRPSGRSQAGRGCG